MSSDALRLRLLAADGNLDVEDVALAMQHALADGRLSHGEAKELKDALSELSDKMEPAARDYLTQLLAGHAPKLVNRVLLAAHPVGEPPDLYYPRSEVVALQESLSRVGHPTSVDGLYGPGTAGAVSEFQESQGIGVTGAVDSRTLARLNLALDDLGLPLLDLTPRARTRPDAVIAARGAGEPEVIRALQLAVNGLRRHFGLSVPRLVVDGDFGVNTEEALRALQTHVLLPPTGVFDTATAEALNLMLAAAGRELLDARPPEGGVGAAEPPVELHFYPGPQEHKVYVLRRGRLVESYGMVGGEEAPREDEHSSVDFTPTPAGTYEIMQVDPHASGVWQLSYVPYGSHLRELDGEVQYRDGDGEWRWATGPRSVFRDRTPPPIGAAFYRDSQGQVPPTFTNNQFGHLRALLRDLRTGRVQSHMIHSSPYTELTRHYFGDTEQLNESEAARSLLRTSHGCEHLHPRDFDEMVAKGYITPGVVFVVHGYDERFGGRAMV